MDNISASSLNALIDVLGGTEVIVERKRSERSNEACELWVLKRVLPFIEDRNRNGDIELQKSEMPDFILSIDGERIGIEVTELIETEVAHALSRIEELADRPEVYSLSEFHRGAAVPANSDELAGLIQPAKSRGWHGDEPEIRSAELCKKRLMDKEEKAAKYQKCSQLIVVGYISNPCVPLDIDALMAHVKIECSTVSLDHINRFYVLYDSHTFQAL